MNQLFTIFHVPELRRKIVITILFLCIYRVGYFIPLPVVDQAKMQESMAAMQGGALGQVLGLVSLFSGGNLSQACIFGLGIMPYISSSIIFQLLASVYPPLEKLQKEGQAGQKKINEYTRYATVPICMVQAFFYVRHIMSSFALPGFDSGMAYFYYTLASVLIMTAGTVFLMWIGEQIDEYGIGNGISLIIMAGIVARIPDATKTLFYDSTTQSFRHVFTLGGEGGQGVGFEKLIVLFVLFIAVVVGVVAITKGQRRIPTQSAKHVRGRRVFGGTRQFLPLRINAAGVMPVIFASSLLLIPVFGFKILRGYSNSSIWSTLEGSFDRQGYIYVLCYIALIYFFCYFWTAIQFNPKDIAQNLKDYGSFIPGYRPGKRTADYLEKVLMRVTYVGAAFLAVIAIIPNLITNTMNVDYRVASFYGGTGLLIVVSVALDVVKKINSHLVMRNYPGLTDD
jgi:preprotein translocase subunit SecY